MECARRGGQFHAAVFDRPPGVMILELHCALVAERGMEPAGVVDLIEKAWKIGASTLRVFMKLSALALS